jgi:hypothetical protein
MSCVIRKYHDEEEYQDHKRHKRNPHSYPESREKSTSTKILRHKMSINLIFTILCAFSEYGPVLIVDSDKQQTRKFLILSGKFRYNQIQTVDNTSLIESKFIHRKGFDKYLETTDYVLFSNVWVDVVCSPLNSRKQCELLFTQRMLVNGGCFAITCCLRNTSSKEFGQWDCGLRRLANKNGYELVPIHVQEELRIKTKKDKTFNIKDHMTDNGRYEGTGRTITAFYRVYDLHLI